MGRLHKAYVGALGLQYIRTIQGLHEGNYLSETSCLGLLYSCFEVLGSAGLGSKV